VKILASLACALFVTPMIGWAQNFEMSDFPPSEIVLKAAPVHGVELGMPAVEAFQILLDAGFIQETNGTTRADTLLHTVTVRAEDDKIEKIAFSTTETWKKDNVRLILAWTGSDPRVEGKIRKFEGEGRIWSISRYENLSEPSSIETILPALQSRFGFEKVLCSGRGGMPGQMQYAVHVSGVGNAEGLELQNIGCLYAFHPQSVVKFIKIGDAAPPLEAVPALSFTFDIQQKSDGLIHATEFTLAAPKTVLSETFRFWSATLEAMKSQGEVGSGMTDF